MQASASVSMYRASINRANAQNSTGPRTETGKRRSSLNALRHGLTAATAVLPSEDPDAYERHCRQFFHEYQPTTPTETQLVQELADTSWRLNRIPLLEAGLFAEVPSPQSLIPQLANLGLHGHRLSRQFQKTLDQLRAIQCERRVHERLELKDAAAILELHKHKGIPWEPSDHGFVFSKVEVERCSGRHAGVLDEKSDMRRNPDCATTADRHLPSQVGQALPPANELFSSLCRPAPQPN